MSCEILPTETTAQFETAVNRAVAALRAGEVVGLPTETVYGLAANAWNPDAVRRIYEIKGRPAHNPVIVHVASNELARDCVRDWPEVADRLAAAFWPGPLTLVLPRGERVPDIVTAGGDTVGVRWPAHPFMQAVIRQADFPLAAPSANRSNEISPTTAAHVDMSLGDRLPLVVDGGPSRVGIESTVLDLTVDSPRILRPGMIGEGLLRDAMGRLATDDSGESPTLKSPGQLPRHYAPRAKLILLRWSNEADLRKQVEAREIQPANAVVIAHSHPPQSGPWKAVHLIPHDPEAYARALYGELRRGDALRPACILVEEPPSTPDWRAIVDRLQRAARDDAGV